MARFWGSESGTGTALGVGMAAAMLIVLASALPSARLITDSRIAAGAADAAALAGADTVSGIYDGDPCERAASVALANGAQLVECTVVELNVSVTVSRQTLGGSVEGRARSGPPGQ